MANQKNIEIEIAGRETIVEAREDNAPKSFRIYWRSGDMRPDFKIYWPSNGRNKREKMKSLDELKNELVNLGMLEGNKTECSNAGINEKCESAYSGVLRKKIKPDLIMEYTFSYPYGGVKNFHLNNVPVDLNEIEEEKVEKLLEIIKKFNLKYIKESQKNSNLPKPKESEDSTKKTQAQKKKQIEVLNKL